MKVAVIGSGYVGLVTGAGLAAEGHEVVCVDVDPKRVEGINGAAAPFHEPGLPELLRDVVGSGKLRATSSHAEAIAGASVVMIAVPTPQAGEPIDLRYVGQAAEDIGTALRAHDGYVVVTVKSTVVPGTTEGIVRERVEAASGKKLGAFGLAMNPEFLREASAVEDFRKPDRIVIGESDARAGAVLEELYASFACPKVHLPLKSAELVKYASNTLLATLISFSNEISAICEAMPDADVERIMDGLHLDRRLSPVVDGQRVLPGILTYLRAGAGYGGSCLPKDVNALRSYAHDAGVKTPLLDAVARVNVERPGKVVDLLERHGGPVRGKVVTVLGLAFKPGTDDLRDSPSLALVADLVRRGATVRGYDPLTAVSARRLLGDAVVTFEDPAAALAGADAALVGTAWPEMARWAWADLAGAMRTPLVMDARNALRGVEWPSGVRYHSIGAR